MSEQSRSLAGDLRRVRELLRPQARRYALGLGSLTVVNVSDVIAPLFLAISVDLTVASLGGPDPTTPGSCRPLA